MSWFRLPRSDPQSPPSPPIRLPSTATARPPPSHFSPPTPTSQPEPLRRPSLPRLKLPPSLLAETTSSLQAPVNSKALPLTPPRPTSQGTNRSPRPTSLPSARYAPLLERRVVSATRRKASVERKVSGEKVARKISGERVERKASGERKVSSEKTHGRKISSEGIRKVVEKIKTASVSAWRGEDIPAVPQVKVPGLLRLPQSVLAIIVREAEKVDKRCAVRLALVCRYLHEQVKIPRYEGSVRHTWHSMTFTPSSTSVYSPPSYYEDSIVAFYLGDHTPLTTPRTTDCRRIFPSTSPTQTSRKRVHSIPPHLTEAGVDQLVYNVANITVEQQFADVFFQLQPETHSQTLKHYSEVENWCNSILSLYHALDPYNQSEKHTLHFRNVIASPEFSGWFNSLEPPVPWELVPAFRSLCHLKVLCGYQRLTGRMSSLTSSTSSNLISAVPPIDLDGTVVWEEIEQIQAVIYAVASQTLQAEDWIIARPALSKVARPRRPLPPPTRDWAHINGEWQALIAKPDPLILRNITLYPKRQLHNIFDSDLPQSEVLPVEHFEGSLNGGVIHGVVRLTTDNPPELRYSLVVCGMRFEGLQVGGFSSRSGVMGVAYEVDGKDEKAGERRVAYPAWFYKLK